MRVVEKGQLLERSDGNKEEPEVSCAPCSARKRGMRWVGLVDKPHNARGESGSVCFLLTESRTRMKLSTSMTGALGGATLGCFATSATLFFGGRGMVFFGGLVPWLGMRRLRR